MAGAAYLSLTAGVAKSLPLPRRPKARGRSIESRHGHERARDQPIPDDAFEGIGAPRLTLPRAPGARP